MAFLTLFLPTAMQIRMFPTPTAHNSPTERVLDTITLPDAVATIYAKGII